MCFWIYPFTAFSFSAIQVFLDVLRVRQLGLCVAVTAQDPKLETTIQVLPLVRVDSLQGNGTFSYS